MPVGVVFLWLAVRNADLDAVRDTLREADAGLVALAIAGFGVVYLFQAARWRRIAATPAVRLARFYEMTVSGVAVNNVLPGRLGDFLRARWLGLDSGMAGGKAFGTVILDRAFDLVVLVGLLIVGIAAVASSTWLAQLAAAGAVVVLGIAGVLLFSRVYIGRRERDRHERGLVRRLVRDTVERLAEPLGRRHLVIWLGLSLAAWAIWAVAALLVARSLGIDLSLTEALFVTAVLNLGSAVPSSPGLRRNLRMAWRRVSRSPRHRSRARSRLHDPRARSLVRAHDAVRRGRSWYARRGAASRPPAGALVA